MAFGGSRTLTAGGDLHPAPKTGSSGSPSIGRPRGQVTRTRGARSRTEGGSVDLAAVDRVGGLRLAFGVLLHLGGHRDRLAVVRERAHLRGRDADRDSGERQPLQLSLAILDLDVPAFDVLGVVEPLHLPVEGLDHQYGDVLGDVGRHDRYEVVSADVPDEPVGAGTPDHGVLQDPRRRLDQAVPLHETLLVVIGLEVVQVRVEDGERRLLADHPLDLLLDADVPGQPGERREVPHLLRSPERALDPREELDRVEGFDDVVVGARGEPEDLVGRERLRGEHYDGRVRGVWVPAEPVRDLETVDARHHHIEQNEIGAQAGGLLERLFPVRGDRDLVARAAEVHLDESGDVRIVVDDQDRLRHQTVASADALSSRAERTGSPAPKIAVAATKTSAPACTHRATVSRFTPPSTCTSTSRPRRSISERSASILATAPGWNGCPAHPGSTARTTTSSASSRKANAASAGVRGARAIPARIPNSRTLRCVGAGSLTASRWKLTASAPAPASSSRNPSGASTWRCAWRGRSVCRRSAATTTGPIVRGGTKCPSMTSIWMRSACSPTSLTSSAKRARSADRMDAPSLAT